VNLLQASSKMKKMKVKKSVSKPVARKTVARKPAGKLVARSSAKPVSKAGGGMTGKKLVGRVTHFFDKITVGVIELSAELKVGDTILIEGHGRSVKQKVSSMQIEHEQVSSAKKGQSVGLKTAKPVKVNDLVFKATS